MKEKKLYKFKCCICNKEYYLELTEKQFNSGKHSFKKYCSRSCANKRQHSKTTKEKIKNSIINSEKYNNEIQNRRAKNKNKYYLDENNKYIVKEYYHCGSKKLNDKYLEISCHPSKKWFIKLIPFGFNINSLGTSEAITEYYKCKDILYNEYIINKLSPKEIYIKYNCNGFINNSETLLHLFKFWRFNIRSHKEALSESILKNSLDIPKPNINKYPYKCGWHTTWDNKKIYYRSSYELDYAKYLDEKQIKYEVEYLRIRYFNSKYNMYKCAIPDFYLPETNEIVEIKSNYTLDIQNIIDKFTRYKELGYKIKLVLEHKEIVINDINDIKNFIN